MGPSSSSLHDPSHLARSATTLAVKNNIKQEDVIKRLFVFSDMQFDRCQYQCPGYVRATDWATNYDAIERAHNYAGFVSQIVYWDPAWHGVEKIVEMKSNRSSSFPPLFPNSGVS
ncbi:hypothetical protein BDZ97DRAFT_1763057 [Flammula alnicola]|nr:hypothetical protein BDZ97DRAFT_1763057 [Flammula alnicola]